MPETALLAIAACLAAVSALAATSAQDQPEASFGVTVVIPFGLEGRVYHIKRNSPRLPDLTRLKPKGTIYTPFIYVPPTHFQNGFPGVTRRSEWFAIEYTGRFWIRKPGPYRFVLTSDDGSQLYIDDRLMIDNDGVHGTLAKTATITLTPGAHSLRVPYFQGPRDKLALMLEVAPPGEGLQVFSTNEFRPPAHVDAWPDAAPDPKKQP